MEGTGLRQREGGLLENLEIAVGEAAGKVLHFCLVEERARGTRTMPPSLSPQITCMCLPLSKPNKKQGASAYRPPLWA